ncbi:FGGY-family carbohydrate kinase [Flexivirga caeni]|uniref:Xylulose kinase n=1 Tax=Flexivirga caeni TaxID=2294115 RepID=A0A3M9LWU3_9MICO|nr:FGGY-family carbohydrate kinase [Flexivirga caeni]RNI17776.1 xylulose kinase [Flexivirga caeni]
MGASRTGEPLVAGVDSSTQSCKIVVCEAMTGRLVRQGRARHPEGTQVDARAWWAAFEEASADGLLDGVSALAVGGQQHGMVTLDAEENPVREAMLWNDTSSAPQAEQLIEELGGAAQWVDAVDLVPVASFTATKLRWLAENEPGNAARTETVVLPHDWLTGRILAAGNGFEGWTTDRGDASGTAYWSPVTGEYRRDLLRLAFGREVGLPRVLGPAEAAGSTAGGMLVAAGTGDNAAAALGLGIAPGDVVVSLGTSGAVFTVHDDSVGDVSGAVAGFADATGRHLPLLATLNAARVLVAAATTLDVDLAGLDALAAQAPIGAGGLTLLPFLDGERSPNLPTAHGTLTGMTRANSTPAHFARAYVEGMLCNLRGCLDALARNGIHARRMLLIGGAAAAGSVREAAANIFGVPVVVPEPGEYVALGAARQAAWALSGAAEPPQWPVPLAATVEPADAQAGAQVARRYRDVLTMTHPGAAVD